MLVVLHEESRLTIAPFLATLLYGLDLVSFSTSGAFAPLPEAPVLRRGPVPAARWERWARPRIEPGAEPRCGGGGTAAAGGTQSAREQKAAGTRQGVSSDPMPEEAVCVLPLKLRGQGICERYPHGRRGTVYWTRFQNAQIHTRTLAAPRPGAAHLETQRRAPRCGVSAEKPLLSSPKAAARPRARLCCRRKAGRAGRPGWARCGPAAPFPQRGDAGSALG